MKYLDNVYNRKEIAKDVFFTSITDEKFKINGISVTFITLLSDSFASLNAVIPRLLTKCNEKLDTMAKLNRKLCDLYSANISWSVIPDIDKQSIKFNASVIDNRFAFNGEDILKETVEILLDCIFSPLLSDGLFPEASLEIEKQNQIDDNNNEINDKTSYSYLRAFEEAHKGEPAAIRWGGTNEQVEEITPQSAIEAYKRMLSQYRVEIICAGESNFDGIDQLFEKAFSKIDRKPEALPYPILSPTKSEVSRVTEYLDVEQSKLVMFFKTSDRYRKKVPLLVAQTLFGGSESSKLFSVVREKMSLCYYCFSRHSFLKGYVTAECGVDKSNLEAAERECINQLNEIVKGSFTDEEVNKAKLYIINILRSTGDSVNGIISRALSNILYPEIGYDTDEYIRMVEEVKREEIIEAANSLRLDTVYVLTPKKEAEV